MEIKKFSLSSTILIIATTLLCSTHLVASDQPNDEDIFAVPKVYAVQNRKYVLGNQLSFTLGYLPMDSFTKGVALGAAYTTYFTDFTGWEVVNATYIANMDTGLKKQLLSDFQADPGKIPDFPKYMITSNIVYTPIYNKNLLFNKSVIWGDISFVAGGGIANFERNKMKPLVDIGAMLRFFVTSVSSLKVDFRENLPFLSEGMKPFLTVGVAYTYQFGATPKSPSEADNIETEFFK